MKTIERLIINNKTHKSNGIPQIPLHMKVFDVQIINKTLLFKKIKN